jgi:predicted DsbA family dithiol-disulfide isomerase
MKVELWGDVVCPGCFLGRRRFETALESFEGKDSIEVLLRSFELDPGAPPSTDLSLDESLARKLGISPAEAHAQNVRLTELARSEGVEFHLDEARPTNTFDAHRLLQLATVRHVRRAVEERFQRAHLCEGVLLSDPNELLRLSLEAGLREDDVRRVLAGQAFTLQVRADEREATEMGADGMPFFLFDRRRTVSGAQPTEFFQQVLRMVDRSPPAAPSNGTVHPRER